MEFESPFTDFVAQETMTAFEEVGELALANPLRDPALIKENAVDETLQFEELEEESGTFPLSSFEGVEEEVKIGDISFTESDSATATSADFKDAANSGNPLVLVSASNRKSKISTNFLGGEYIRAQGGKFTWDHARLDPALIENIQQLRNFIGRPIEIVDGYYPPKYAKQVLKIADDAAIAKNPHVSGRGAKFSVKGYERNMLDIAIAASLVCDDDMKISVGEETMAAYVKQATNDPKLKFTSYIRDEKRKVDIINFCINFNKVLSGNSFADYGAKLQRATAKLLAQILMRHYGLAKEIAWPDEIGDVISIMHIKNEEVPPEVILYAIAYSPFGNLARFYLKDKTQTKGDTASILVNASARPADLNVPSMPNTFYYLQKQPDKTGFIKLCYDRYDAQLPHEKPHHLARKNFFNWKFDAGDKLFYQEMTTIIKKVYKDNGYKYAEIIQQLPEGGTRRELTLTDPHPDKPKVDFTGKYYVEFPNDQGVSGSYLLINQAGNYISGKFGSIHKNALRVIKITLTNKTPKNLKDTVMSFFGKINENGEAICDFPPQMSISLKKISGKVQFTIKDNVSGKELGSWIFAQRSPIPMISESMMNFFTAAQPDKQDLFVTLAWAQPLPSQLKKFGQFLKDIESNVQKAIIQYYSIEEDMQSVRTSQQERAVRAFESEYRYVFLPNYDQFVNYCTRFFFSKARSWRPRDDREFMSEYDWIKRMLGDFRGVKGSKNIQASYERMYRDFGVDTSIDNIEYKYEVSLKTSAFGIGPASKISGTIVIENKTDYNKYPQAEKWNAPNNKVEYSLDFWNLSLAISLTKWLPKISAKWDVTADATTSIPYRETDFSGARMDMVEWTAFDISAGITTGNNKVGVSTGLTKRFLYIVPRGKHELELEGLDTPSVPDTLTIEPSDKDDSVFDFSGPSASFYRGEIDTKKISTDISSLPLPEQFESVYRLQSTRYFKHDDGTLSAAAIEAIGRMCAEELVALTDPQSELEIYGHTDASGKPEHNLTLSAVRAANTMQAIEDRLGKDKLKIKVKKVSGLGETEANQKFGQFTEKNAWLRRVVIIINGRAVLSLGQL